VQAVRGGENHLELLRLCAVGLRCAADRGATGDRVGAMAAGDRLAREGWDARPAKPAPETEQLVRLCQAERKRLQGTDSATDWAAVATGWADLDRPYEAAYARWRQAAVAGDRAAARAASHAARTLGAEPLRAAVAALAAKHRLDLADRPAPATLPYALTPAEFATLQYRCQGRDATQIAGIRGVTRRTVETQLSKVYRKMGVQNAGQAMAKAYQEGLVS
jgi:DNA-binding CsgD family transcriptional regulator